MKKETILKKLDELTLVNVSAKKTYEAYGLSKEEFEELLKFIVDNDLLQEYILKRNPLAVLVLIGAIKSVSEDMFEAMVSAISEMEEVEIENIVSLVEVLRSVKEEVFYTYLTVPLELINKGLK